MVAKESSSRTILLASLATARAGDAHGQANVGFLEGRGVVGAVAGDGDHLAQFLQQFHHARLVQRPGAGQDPEIGKICLSCSSLSALK